MQENFKALKDLFAKIEEDFEKLTDKGTKASAKRIRGFLMDFQKVAKTLRGDLLKVYKKITD